MNKSSNNGKFREGKSDSYPTIDDSVWSRVFKSESEWPDKEEFLDVIYWMRQILGIVLGLIWGIIPLTGILGLAMFCGINSGLVYIYFSMFQKIDEEEYGGPWELTKEGFMASFAGFLVTWTIIYSGLHFSDEDLQLQHYST